MLETVAADIRATVDTRHGNGLGYWGRVGFRLLFAPALHVVLLHRLAHALYSFLPTRPLAFAVRMVSVVWGGTEIHPSARIGPGFSLTHSLKVVIGADVVIGRNCRMSHGVSIGGDTGRHGPGSGAAPVIGDDVTIALDAIVMGDLTVGDGAVIAAQALVVTDVPARVVMAGSPARPVKKVGA